MSSSPPPPPPYASAPQQVAPQAWSRRALRQQRRAALVQFRQQRTLQRAQLRSARRTSVLGPTLLLSLGVVFLLLELGKVHPAATAAWLGNWWPLILVSAGFILLLEWAADTWIATQRGVAAPPRRVGAGTSLLLVLLIVSGVSLFTVRNRPDWISQTWNPEFADALGLQEIFSHHSETEQDLSSPLAPRGLLTIRNFRGNITVNGVSQDGLVHVSARQRLSAWQGSELRAKQRRDRPSLEQQGSGLLLQVHGDDRDTTDLSLEVPHETAVVIEPEKGELAVTELRGPLTIKEHSGGVTLTALAGTVHLTESDDNAAITGHSLSGDLTVLGRSGDLALSDVTGPVTLHGDFFGTTHLEHINGAVHFQSSFTDLACLGIPGELNVEGRSDLQGSNLAGPVTLHTSNRNLVLAGVHNGAVIDDRNGSVTLSLADPLAPVKVTTTNGSVDLGIPDRASLTLSATTLSGQISNDLGLSSSKHEDRTTLAGPIRAGGPEVSLSTKEGDIHIHHGSVTAQATEPPGKPDEDD